MQSWCPCFGVRRWMRRWVKSSQICWDFEICGFIKTNLAIFEGMNIHLPAILGFTRYQGFDPSPDLWIYQFSKKFWGVFRKWEQHELPSKIALLEKEKLTGSGSPRCDVTDADAAGAEKERGGAGFSAHGFA